MRTHSGAARGCVELAVVILFGCCKGNVVIIGGIGVGTSSGVGVVVWRVIFCWRCLWWRVAGVGHSPCVRCHGGVGFGFCVSCLLAVWGCGSVCLVLCVVGSCLVVRIV